MSGRSRSARFLTAAVAATAAGLGLADEPPSPRLAGVSYRRDVAPIVEDQCLPCHDETTRTSDLSLHSVAAMREGGTRGPAIVPGQGAKSLLVQFLRGQRTPKMPPKGEVPADQIARIERWINQGARDDASPAVGLDQSPLDPTSQGARDDASPARPAVSGR